MGRSGELCGLSTLLEPSWRRVSRFFFGALFVFFLRLRRGSSLLVELPEASLLPCTLTDWVLLLDELLFARVVRDFFLFALFFCVRGLNKHDLSYGCCYFNYGYSVLFIGVTGN
jgi:hypothetical protein